MQSYDHVDWRWTAHPLMFLGIHYSVLMFLPLLLITRLSWFTIYALAAYVVFLVYCKRKRLGPFDYIRFLVVRWLYRDTWIVR